MKLYNTLTRKTEDLIPQNSNRVTLYTCGPTVYSEPHIGNWVAYIRWDILVRTLKASGYDVTRVMNITDVGHLTSDADDGEDKMEKGARREGVTAWKVAERYTKLFLDGMDSLNLIRPEYLAKATDNIAEQISLVKTLEEKGYTYDTSDGVYFDTSKFNTYADFAKLDLEALKEGARVQVNNEKRNPTDFALWKLSPKNSIRDMEWDSPWGRGFPGWHLECSAMAMKYLGETLDIHTGGIDHIPVHHTNEIAQSEAATGKRFSNYWLHCAHLLSNGTKLSKSLNNSYSLNDLKDKGFSPLDFRVFISQSNYQTETNFTFDNLEAAKNRLSRWRGLSELRWQIADSKDSNQAQDIDLLIGRATDSMLDNLDTPNAMKFIDSAFDRFDNTNVNHSALNKLIDFIDSFLGLALRDSTPDIDEQGKNLIEERQRSRDLKDFDQSDRIRESLSLIGIGLNDDSSGTTWYRK